MKKRRIFDIDFSPEEESLAKTETDGKEESRRGPMAVAITENADALKARAQAEEEIRRENDQLAFELVRLKKEGLITDLIELDKISIAKLTRDRSQKPDPDLQELKDSIQAIGLSNPIRVEAGPDGFELVQGFRRLSAYKALYAETGNERYARIPAGLIATGETLENLYRKMVDENLVRRNVSFAEMAQLALEYAKDKKTSCNTVEEAVAVLYASSGRQKRSYIRHFATLLSEIGPTLKYPEAIPRALGLRLERRLAKEPGAAEKIKRALGAGNVRCAEDEIEILKEEITSPVTQPKKKPAGQGAAKTSLRMHVPAGTVRCLARSGKVEIAMDRDFSDVDRQRLERAVAAFLAALE